MNAQKRTLKEIETKGYEQSHEMLRAIAERYIILYDAYCIPDDGQRLLII